jgi:hypothetical protein
METEADVSVGSAAAFQTEFGHSSHEARPGSSNSVGGEPKLAAALGRAQCMPAAVSCIATNAWSRVKVFGFWTGGKSLKVAAHIAPSAWAP